MPEQQRGGWAAKATYTERKNKSDVNYRNGEKCQMCDFFVNGKCQQVEGNISPEAVCDLWAMRSFPKYHDGQFYLDEYNKRGKK